VNYRDFSNAVAGVGASASAKSFARVAIPGIDSPVQLKSKIFTFQSYFDSTLLQQALLEQNQNEPIVRSTLEESQISGYGLGLLPSSQTPIAVQFMAGSGQASASATQILRPGDVIWPMGEQGKAFSGFRWGLPFGWLGGGMASIVVLPTARAKVDWAADAEVIYHRARYEIKQAADLTLAGTYNNAAKNWPMRFPWTQALRDASSISQSSKPSISIARPTRVLLVLRGVTTIAAGAGARLRVIMQATNDVGLDSAGAAVLTTPMFDEISFPEWSSLGTSGNLATQNPGVMYEGLLARVAADDGGVLFLDVSSVAATLTGGFVDCVRYGKL
jgi:hypothetical protein